MTRIRRLSIVCLLFGVALAAAACAKSNAASVSSNGTVGIPASQFKAHTDESTVTVDAVDNDFQDAFITISPGTKVTWTNVGRNDHSVTPVKSGSFQGASTGQFTPGQSHSVIFTRPGDYPYFCSIHGTKNLEGQAGVVRVVAKA